MTSVRKFHPEVRLKKLLAESGGITAGQALDRANEGLESIREDCLAGVDEKLTQLTQLAASSEAERGKQMYRCANEIFAEAGAFGLAELSAAAHSLCSLLSNVEDDRLPSSAIKVHIDAMRALRRPDVSGNAAARAAVLSGLRGLAKRHAG
ncbi:MAG: hypothetical protein JNM59_04665 [Hyphomonadaceae bacterium]|nr:hypothetical protein [Hyphomonadaceae bacterium]